MNESNYLSALGLVQKCLPQVTLEPELELLARVLLIECLTSLQLAPTTCIDLCKRTLTKALDLVDLPSLLKVSHTLALLFSQANQAQNRDLCAQLYIAVNSIIAELPQPKVEPISAVLRREEAKVAEVDDKLQRLVKAVVQG